MLPVYPVVADVPSRAVSAAAPAVLRSDRAVVTLRSGTLELIPIGDSAIRVRFYDKKPPESPDFVFTKPAATPKFTLTERGETVTVAGKRMRAVVDRRNGSIRFEDAAGKVFLAEKPGSRRLTPTTPQNKASFAVEQAFHTAKDEHLYGLGQYQDGIWDWRGIPLEMRQVNTQIAVPMLVSSKGYAILWDNASRTEFNPLRPGEQIPLSITQAAPEGAARPTATEQLGQARNGPRPGPPLRQATFTTGDSAGTYVFSVRDADRRNEITLLVDGAPVAGVKNTWTPRAVVGTVSLPARKTVNVTVRGGGRDVKLFARAVDTATSTFGSDDGEAVDYTVFYGPKLDDVIAGYRGATGAAPLWPKWAYGFWQCRERYSSQQQLLDTAAEFRRRRIPVDLLVQDWQYWGPHGWGSYEWDEAHYPDPAAMIKGLHDQNVRFMISVWCNPHGKALAELQKNNLMTGEWIDLFNPLARQIRWKYLNQAFFSIGTDGWWGDATEPGDPGTDLLGKQVSIGPGDRYTSAYPLFASQSLYEGQRAADPGKRVVTLTRSAFPGQQRYGAAAWSGDINGDWETLKRQIPAGLNFALTGMPYWTTDAGGFFRPPGQYKSEDYNELLARWFQWSAFCPILRSHGYQTETEPWKWLPATQQVMLDYDRLRYRMLPYNYSVAWQITSSGSTSMRPLGMDFPGDPRVWSISSQYMFGPAFLVAPVTEPKAQKRPVYLPKGTGWVNFWTGAPVKGNQEVVADAPLRTLPLFVRAGSIVPLGPDLQYAGEKSADPIELRVYPGADGKFVLYEDEGDSYRYERGTYATIPITWDDRKSTLTLGERSGTFPGMPAKRTFRVILVSPGQGIGIEQTERATELPYDGQRRVVVLRPK